ncbi:MAG: NADH:ubiquinone reductase (Na(+)-transporting) subunit A, partial [Pseudomonadales bacterium]|nr:NADH:ubiquinone reductase (Na(+)-transporting) subunit A [Pseudomonadales bacterium]
MIKIKRGLDLPIGGAPQQSIEQGARARSVALIGFDYVGMKPTMEVTEGDSVKLGQLLFTDKKTPGVRYTAPGAGRVAAINRGEKRALQSVVIELDGDAALSYDAVAPGQLASLSNQAVRERMLDSGAWTALRTRPYSKVPAPDAKPAAIFVTAIDTNPLAADPALIIASRENDFTNGLTILSRLGAEKLFCCTAEGVNIELGNSGAVQETFTGPHPAGLAGTHIHHLCPASSKRSVLWINYQDVIALGVLFSEGRIDVERIVALGGPAVDKPRLLKTRLGASTDELVAGEHSGGDNRVLSGSVFNGRKARGPYAYLGRY